MVAATLPGRANHQTECDDEQGVKRWCHQKCLLEDVQKPLPLELPGVAVQKMIAKAAQVMGQVEPDDGQQAGHTHRCRNPQTWPLPLQTTLSAKQQPGQQGGGIGKEAVMGAEPQGYSQSCGQPPARMIQTACPFKAANGQQSETQ